MSVHDSRTYALMPNVGDAADIAITGSGTIIGQWLENIGGMDRLSGQVWFALGTGSGGVTLYIQSSMDQGSSAYDVVKASFDDIPQRFLFSFTEGSPIFATPSSGGTGDSPELPDGIVCQVLGDRLRAYVVVEGSYQNTQLSIRVIPK